MKKKKRSQSRFSRTRRFIILFIAIDLAFLLILLLNNSHVHFRLHNMLYPISGEFVFSSNHNSNNRYYNIFHADFNTALNTITITQLTPDDRDSFAPVYSPDGQQIAYYAGHHTYLMDANGTNQQQLTEGIYPQWLDNNKLIIQRLIGTQITTSLSSCPIYAPVLVDLTTGEESDLFTISDYYSKYDNGIYNFPGHQKLASCRTHHASRFGEYIITKDTRLIPYLDPAHPLQIQAFNREVVTAHTSEQFAKAEVFTWRDYGSISGIYVSDKSEDWKLIKKVHASYVDWSPDDSYLIYSAEHPDRTSVIAIISAVGNYTYPLLGNDGFNYHAPNWKP